MSSVGIDVEYLDISEGYAYVSVNGEITIQIDYSYIDHNNEVYDREDHAWYNTTYGKSERRFIISYEISVQLYSNSDGEFDDLNFDDIKFLMK